MEILGKGISSCRMILNIPEYCKIEPKWGFGFDLAEKAGVTLTPSCVCVDNPDLYISGEHIKGMAQLACLGKYSCALLGCFVYNL